MSADELTDEQRAAALRQASVVARRTARSAAHLRSGLYKRNTLTSVVQRLAWASGRLGVRGKPVHGRLASQIVNEDLVYAVDALHAVQQYVLDMQIKAATWARSDDPIDHMVGAPVLEAVISDLHKALRRVSEVSRGIDVPGSENNVPPLNAPPEYREPEVFEGSAPAPAFTLPRPIPRPWRGQVGGA